jgi:hypothetical protein
LYTILGDEENMNVIETKSVEMIKTVTPCDSAYHPDFNFVVKRDYEIVKNDDNTFRIYMVQIINGKKDMDAYSKDYKSLAWAYKSMNKSISTFLADEHLYETDMGNLLTLQSW